MVSGEFSRSGASRVGEYLSGTRQKVVLSQGPTTRDLRTWFLKL